MRRVASIGIENDQDLAHHRQHDEQRVSDPGCLWGRFVVAPQPAARRRRVVVVFGRSTRVRQKRRDEDDAAAADSMSNLVVRTCTRERGREREREETGPGRTLSLRSGVKTIFLLARSLLLPLASPERRRTSRVRRSRNSLLTALAMNNCLPVFRPSWPPSAAPLPPRATQING